MHLQRAFSHGCVYGVGPSGPNNSLGSAAGSQMQRHSWYSFEHRI